MYNAPACGQEYMHTMVSFQTAIHYWHLNLLDSDGNYSATSNNTKLEHWPLMNGLLHLVGGSGRAAAPLSPLLALPK